MAYWVDAHQCWCNPCVMLIKKLLWILLTFCFVMFCFLATVNTNINDIDGLAGEEEQLAKLVEHLNKASTAYGMEISAEKTKLMTINTSGINTEIKVNGQKLETVISFQYLGSVITDEGSKPELLCRIAQATAALTRLKPIWIYKSISLSSKIRLMRSLVTSIFQYACESWTLTAELQRRIQAMEMRCYRKILHISYKDHVTNEEVRAKIQQRIFLDKGRGGQRKRWEDNIREWTGLEFGKSQRAVENRGKWRKLVAKSSVVPQRPSRLMNWWWWWRWWWWWWWIIRTRVRPQQLQEQRLLFVPVGTVFSRVQTMVWLPVLEIFTVHTQMSMHVSGLEGCRLRTLKLTGNTGNSRSLVKSLNERRWPQFLNLNVYLTVVQVTGSINNTVKTCIITDSVQRQALMAVLSQSRSFPSILCLESNKNKQTKANASARIAVSSDCGHPFPFYSKKKYFLVLSDSLSSL